ncbi:hypothetical protein [Thermococcus sp.]
MGPFSQYIYGETPGYVEYIILGIWVALLIITIFMFYTLNRNINAVLEEAKVTTSLASELRNESKAVKEILREV